MSTDDWKRLVAALLSAATLYFSADNNKQLAEHGGAIRGLDQRVENNTDSIRQMRQRDLEISRPSDEQLVRPRLKKKGGE